MKGLKVTSPAIFCRGANIRVKIRIHGVNLRSVWVVLLWRRRLPNLPPICRHNLSRNLFSPKDFTDAVRPLIS